VERLGGRVKRPMVDDGDEGTEAGKIEFHKRCLIY
jgi:hypothetical protein